jgi:peptide/nickel transport system ATP-binding protein
VTAALRLTGVSVDLPLAGGLIPFLSRPQRLSILIDVSLTVRDREALALVGESGSGKTTLARAVTGLQPISAGSVEVAPGSRDGGPGGLRGGDIALMFQDAVASLSPRMTVGDLLTEPFIIAGRSLPDRRAKATEMLASVGLPTDFVRRYPHELSGGQARRVCVARALALRPGLVIADEPTAGLDVSVQADILNLMTGLQRRVGVAYLIITHNLALVRHVADRLAVLYLGRVVEEGPTARVFARPAHPYTASLIAAEPLPDPRRRRADLAIRGEIPSILRRPSGCEFHTRCPRAEALCRTDAPALRPVGRDRQARCHFAMTET